ncbi:MAG TPA: hypothetical protein VFL83_15530 [Anaeromyxobacter sp.]|nr:hypothetical protein [Anaeromyxobacter sp.]
MKRVRRYGALEMRAYHEAGHVLVALLEGFRVKRVTISRHGPIGGACEYGLAVPRRASRRALRGVVGATAAVALAGSAAQEREGFARGLVAPDPRTGAPSPLFAAGSEGDERIATRFARRLHPRAQARRAFLGRVRTQVERVLDDPSAWSAVRRLARALLRDGTLTGDEAARTARRAIADGLRRGRPARHPGG